MYLMNTDRGTISGKLNHNWLRLLLVFADTEADSVASPRGLQYTTKYALSKKDTRSRGPHEGNL